MENRMTMVRDAGGSGVAIMAARVEDSGGRQWRWWQTRTVVDNDGGR